MVDHIYGVNLYKDELMFDNKHFYVDDADNIIIDVRYAYDMPVYPVVTN